MVRAPYFDKNGLKKGAWSQEEDDKLRAYVLRYGHWNWRALPTFAGLARCGKSCRLRWLNYLRPDVKHGNYTKKEDGLIIKLHKQFGNKWSRIAAELPGRSDNDIKNHWHTHLKKRTEKGQSSSRLKETFQYEVISQNGDLKVESFVPNTPSYPILENSPLSPELSSSLTSGSILVIVSNTSTSSNWIAEDSLSSFGTFENTSGDFWTQPFIADQDGCKLPTPERELVSPYFSYYDDNIDLFYQLMQELPGN